MRRKAFAGELGDRATAQASHLQRSVILKELMQRDAHLAIGLRVRQSICELSPHPERLFSVSYAHNPLTHRCCFCGVPGCHITGFRIGAAPQWTQRQLIGGTGTIYTQTLHSQVG